MKKKLLKQIGWFTGIGVINTGVDFLVLNLLVVAVGNISSLVYLIFRTIAFLAANANSYFLNTRFTFVTERSARSYGSFLGATLVGLGCNVLLSFVSFNLLSNTVSQGIAVNVSALIGTVMSMIVNFILYKYVVFSPSTKSAPVDTTEGK